MTRPILILFVALIVCTSGCVSPFRRATDVPSCYFPRPNKAVEPMFRTTDTT